MDRVTEYPKIIKRLLHEREQMAKAVLPQNLEVRCFFDDEHRQYALITVGWMRNKRISGNTLFLTLRSGKIWIEEDRTDAPIAMDLLANGVPSHDIVLAFQSPGAHATMETAA